MRKGLGTFWYNKKILIVEVVEQLLRLYDMRIFTIC